MQLRSPRVAGELQVHFVPIGPGEPSPIVIFIEDVGRMRQQATQMKLVALGRLTASIAHEIRNPLSSIGHAADLLKEDPEQNEDSKRLLEIVQNNVVRLDRIVQEVLLLNRRDRAQPEAIDAVPYLTNFAHEFCATEKVPDGGLDIQVRTTQRLLVRSPAPGPGVVERRAQRVAPWAQGLGLGAHRRVALRGTGAPHDRRDRRRPRRIERGVGAHLRTFLHDGSAGHRPGPLHRA